MTFIAEYLRVAAEFLAEGKLRQAWHAQNAVAKWVPAELAARVRHALDCDDHRAGAKELDDIATVLSPPAKPRRQRKPSIPKTIAAAERSGKTVTSITTPDGVTLHFGKNESTEASNPWPLDDFKVTKQ